MNLKGKCSSLIFLVISLISCSEKETSEEDVFLTVSERKKFHIGESGLVPERFSTVSLDSSRRKGMVFNEIVHSLDSIFLSADSAWVKEGEFLEAEGPHGVGTVFSFFASEQHIVYINSQEFFKQDIYTKEVSRKLLHEYDVFGDLGYPAISIESSNSSEFSALDAKTNTAYFVYVNDNEISVLGYNPVADFMDFIPVPIDSANFFNLRFEVKTGGLTLLGNDDPQLSVVDSKLIVSYPSFSDILVYELESGNHQVFYSTSNSFPDKRTPPEHFGGKDVDVDSFELLNLWREQVRFGPITYLDNLDKYVRFVKGEEQTKRPFYLEIFDSNFKKLKEFNLTEMQPDLSPKYLNTKYGLMFRAKDQPVEDVMYYYYVNLSEEK